MENKRWNFSLRYILFDLELLVDKLTSFGLIMLIFILYIDVFHLDVASMHETLFFILDIFIFIIFLADLVFKYLHVHNFPKFLKYYWLEIIAVFPFFLFLRAFESIVILTQAGERVQSLVHTGVVAEKEAAALVKEAEVLAKEGKIIPKFLISFSKLPRFLKLIPQNSIKGRKMRVKKILNVNLN